MRSKPNRPASLIRHITVVTIIVAIIAVAFITVVIMADIIAVVITATAIITAAGGTKSQRLRNQKRQDLIPGAFLDAGLFALMETYLANPRPLPRQPWQVQSQPRRRAVIAMAAYSMVQSGVGPQNWSSNSFGVCAARAILTVGLSG